MYCRAEKQTAPTHSTTERFIQKGRRSNKSKVQKHTFFICFNDSNPLYMQVRGYEFKILFTFLCTSFEILIYKIKNPSKATGCAASDHLYLKLCITILQHDSIDLLAILKKNLNRTTLLHFVEFSNVHNSDISSKHSIEPHV